MSKGWAKFSITRAEFSVHLIDLLLEAGSVSVGQGSIGPHVAVVIEALVDGRPDCEVHTELCLQGLAQHVTAAVPEGLQHKSQQTQTSSFGNFWASFRQAFGSRVASNLLAFKAQAQHRIATSGNLGRPLATYPLAVEVPTENEMGNLRQHAC